MVKEYEETHQHGHITLENMPEEFYHNYIRGSSGIMGSFNPCIMEGDLGIQVAEDGRVWVCIDGVAFLRFKPGRSVEASQLLDWFRKRQRETKSSTLTMVEFDKKYKQLFGSCPTWYSWGPFYRDHGFAGLRAGRKGANYAGT